MPHHPFHVMLSLFRAQRVLLRHVPALSPIDLSPERRALDVAIRDARQATVARDIAKVAIDGAHREIHSLRFALWTASIQPTVVFARKKLPDNPEVAALVTPPRTAGALTMILGAHALAGVIQRYEAEFKLAGLSSRAVPNLVARAERLSAEVKGLRENQRWYVRAQTALSDALGRGRTAIAMLDSHMQAEFGDRPDVVALWKSAKRVVRPEHAPVVLRRAA